MPNNIAKTVAGLVVLLLILGGVYFLQRQKSKSLPQAMTSVSPSAALVQPGESVVYALTVENPGKEILAGYIVEASIMDLQELSTLVDAQGANYNSATGSLVWTPLDVAANGSIQKKITVRVKNDLPASSDLVMKLRFGNETSVAVARAQALTPTPSPSSAGGSPGETPGNVAGAYAPQSGPSGWLSFILALGITLSVSIYRFKRSII